MNFDKETGKIVIMMHGSIMMYPPALSLIEYLLDNNYNVHLVSSEQAALPDSIMGNKFFSCVNICVTNAENAFERAASRIKYNHRFREQLVKQVKEQDIVWTLNPRIIRTLGSTLNRYSDRHIMQLYELMGDFYPLFSGDKLIGVNLSNYARNAWKTVVSERNRAYIQKTVWKLNRLPYVIPNKPYRYEAGAVTEDMIPVIRSLENENRKVIMYLGVFNLDRTFEEFAEAIEALKDEFRLYIFGYVSETAKDRLDKMCKKYSCVRHMGFFPPPKHLIFLKYAYCALVPYFPGVSVGGTSVINALYCAPNKIWEYAGSGVPMIGTDVLGLREPFEKYGMGVCCDNLERDTIIDAIRYTDIHHDEMVKGCNKFYQSVDIGSIIEKIINE